LTQQTQQGCGHQLHFELQPAALLLLFLLLLQGHQ
jgi:hypothetical protein